MNNQNKINLILFIANTFNDEQCANLLESFTENISAKRAMAWAKNAAAALVVANSAQWEESDHPRENDGRFAPKGRAGAPRPPECNATVKIVEQLKEEEKISLLTARIRSVTSVIATWMTKSTNLKRCMVTATRALA